MPGVQRQDQEQRAHKLQGQLAYVNRPGTWCSAVLESFQRICSTQQELRADSYALRA